MLGFPMTLISSGLGDIYAPYHMDGFASSSSSIQKVMETDSTTNAIINTAKTSNNSMNQNENEHPCIPERLLPLFNAKMSEQETLAKWIDEFLPRPEPPRFFRPLCSRLARQNEILREQEKHYTENANKEIEEVRKRLNMSIRQIREEQKTQLKEKRIEQKQKRRYGHRHRHAHALISSSKSNDKKEKIDWPNGIKEELPPSSAGYQNCKNMHSNSKEEAKRRGKSQHIRKSTYSTH